MGERGFRAQPLGIITGGGEQLRANLNSHTESGQQCRCGPRGQLGEGFIELVDLCVQHGVAAGQRPQRNPDRDAGSAAFSGVGRSRDSIATRWTRWTAAASAREGQPGR